MRTCFICFLFAATLNILPAQNINYARKVIDTLTSETFAGRGYSDNGIQKAAKFIENEYIHNGAYQFRQSYKQEFSIPLNRITHCRVEKGKLKAGYDFVVNILSGDISGKYRVISVTDDYLTDSQKLKKFLETDHSDIIIAFPPSVYENPEFTDVIHDIVYSGFKKAKGFITGMNKQPSWHVGGMFMPSSEAAILSIREDDQYFRSLKKIHIEVSSERIQNYPLSNVCGYLPGTVYPDSFIVFCAHYDHLGRMGDVIYPGANDNASGVAMMLDLMNHYSDSAFRLPYSVAFLALTAEEAGILGAEYFVSNPLFDLSKIKFLINLDIIGTGKEGIQVVNGSVFREEFDILLDLNEENHYVSQIKIRGEACNSDHCPFYKKGIPSFFIYTLDQDYPWYHVPQDNATNLPLTAYENLFLLITDFSRMIQ